MDNETEIVSEYITNLPQTLRGYLLRKTWIQKVITIANTNKLTEDQTASFKGEVFLALIGMENYSDFTTNIQKNVMGIDTPVIGNIVADTEKLIFDEIKLYLLDIEKTNNEAEKVEEEHPDKETILKDIENPVPAKVVIHNPAGKNPILDAQHNLPEGEHQKLISTPAISARGPVLNNFKNSFATAPIAPKPPVTMPAAPVIPKVSVMPQTPIRPTTPTIPPVQPFTQPQKPVSPQVQSPKPPQAPVPPAPNKYTIDPYREPVE